MSENKKVKDIMDIICKKYLDNDINVNDAAKIENELENILNEKEVDRVKDWDDFSKYMRNYIDTRTVKKYGQSSGMDLMSFTEPRICVWCIIRYAMRLWTGSGKRYDLEKIIHYAQMAIKLSGGDLTTCGVREDQNPGYEFWKE